MFNFMRLPPLRRLMLMKAITGGGSWSTISGNPVSFTARNAPLRQLQVAFSPVQDLHGYDAPWPAGGGVNKYDYDNSGIVLQNLSLTGRTYANTATDTRDYFAFGALAYNGSTLIPDSVTTINVRKTGRAQLQITINSECTKIRIRHSGASTNLNIDYPWTRQGTFTISIDVLGYDASTVGGLSFKDVVIADGDVTVTTYSPYSNLCPISGWDSLEVFLTNGNLWSPTDSEAGYINASGAISGQGSTSLEYSSDYVLVPDSVTYVTFGYGAYESDESKWGMIGLYDEQKNFIARQGSVGANGLGTYNIRAYQNVKYIRGTTRTYGHGTDKCFLAFGRDVPFTPYNPSSRSISISLGQTVYSGWVDVISGVGEIDWVGIDGGSLTWKKVSGNAYRTFVATLSPAPKKGNDPSTAIHAMCPNYKSKSFRDASVTEDNYIWVSAENSDSLCIKDTSRAEMSVSEFTEYMTGMTIVYRLATPITIQLTPQEVESLAGDNNLWSDANQPLTVTYRSN